MTTDYSVYKFQPSVIVQHLLEMEGKIAKTSDLFVYFFEKNPQKNNIYFFKIIYVLLFLAILIKKTQAPLTSFLPMTCKLARDLPTRGTSSEGLVHKHPMKIKRYRCFGYKRTLSANKPQLEKVKRTGEKEEETSSIENIPLLRSKKNTSAN